jgi:hypothetical protein
VPQQEGRQLLALAPKIVPRRSQARTRSRVTMEWASTRIVLGFRSD